MSNDERAIQFTEKLSRTIASLAEEYQDVLSPRVMKEIREYTAKRNHHLVGFAPAAKGLDPIFIIIQMN